MLEQHFSAHYKTYLLRPIALGLNKFIGANQATLQALLWGVFVLPLLLLQHPYLAILSLVISGFFDTLDGELARIEQETSPFGAILDILCDRVVEASVIIALFAVAPESRALPALLMLSCILLCVTSFLVTAIFSKNNSEKSFYYSPGLIERPEAFLFFILMMLVPKTFSLLAYLFSALVLWTTYRRLQEFRQVLD